MILNKKLVSNYFLEIISSRVKISLKSCFNLAIFISLKKLLHHHRENGSAVLIVNNEKIGDLTLSIDFLHSFSKCEVYSKKYLLIDSTYENFLAETILDYEVITYDRYQYRYNIIYRIKILKKINELCIDTAINISPERGSVNDELTLLSGARKKIALKSTSRFIPKIVIKYYNNYYSKFIDSTHTNKYYELNDLLEYHELKLVQPEVSFKIQVQSHDHHGEKYILISPSASEQFRNWSKENFRVLVEKLSSEKNEKIILMGTENQTQILKYISEGLSNVKLCINAQFDELLSLIWNCKIFIGLDSGMTHLALQMKKPLIAIIGGGKHGIFFPYKDSDKAKFLFHRMDCFGCNWICKYQKPYCIDNVSGEEVLKAYNEIIGLQNR